MEPIENSTEMPSTEDASKTTASAKDTPQIQHGPEFPAFPTIPAHKRALSTSASSATTTENITKTKTGNNLEIKQSAKKIKENPSVQKTTNYSSQLEPAKEFLECNMSKYPLDFDKLVAFLESTRGKSNIIEIANMFTSDLETLKDMLTDIYKYLTNRSIKYKITRIRNQLNSDASLSQSESESYTTE